jgi:hypothetical protein
MFFGYVLAAMENFTSSTEICFIATRPLPPSSREESEAMNIEAYAERLAYLASRAEAIGDREVNPPAMTVDECRKVVAALRGVSEYHEPEQMIHIGACVSSVQCNDGVARVYVGDTVAMLKDVARPSSCAGSSGWKVTATTNQPSGTLKNLLWRRRCVRPSKEGLHKTGKNHAKRRKV